MTNFHLTFLWIFPYNMGNNDRKGADPGMRKVDHNKQQKRESLLDSAFSLFIDNGFNKTSIADIVKNNWFSSDMDNLSLFIEDILKY